MGKLVFLDTETTGLSLEDDIWEFAAIIWWPGGLRTVDHFFIEHDPKKAVKLPKRFRADHDARYNKEEAVSQKRAAEFIHEITGNGAHIVGAVPNFDTERLALLLRKHGYEPGWHYHIQDAETLTVGYLRGRGESAPNLPWDSDELSRRIGVEPPSENERHTALGDAFWAERLYGTIMGEW
jgi:hypothetical protein